MYITALLVATFRLCQTLSVRILGKLVWNLKHLCMLCHSTCLMKWKGCKSFLLWIIQPNLSYAEALVALDITSLYERRQASSKALIDQIVRDQGYKLHELLPPRNGSTYCT